MAPVKSARHGFRSVEIAGKVFAIVGKTGEIAGRTWAISRRIVETVART